MLFKGRILKEYSPEIRQFAKTMESASRERTRQLLDAYRSGTVSVQDLLSVAWLLGMSDAVTALKQGEETKQGVA